MKILCGLLLSLTNITIFGAELKYRHGAEGIGTLIKIHEELYRSSQVEKEKTYEARHIDLLAAVRKGNVQVCKHLFAQGGELLDAIDGALLVEAIRGNHVNCVELLLDKGANVSELVKVFDGGQPIFLCNLFVYEAVKVGSREILRLLYKKVGKYCGFTLSVAVLNQDFPLVRWLVEQRVPLYVPPIGTTALHEAAGVGNDAIIEFLAHHADVNDKDGANRRPLHYAAKNGHLSSMELLKRLGADENLRDYKGKTVEDLFKEFCSPKFEIKPTKR